MSEAEFTKLFRYIEDFRKEVNDKFEKTASQASLDSLINTLDAFFKRLDNTEVNDLARDAQFERLLAWARKVSKKTGIPLENL